MNPKGKNTSMPNLYLIGFMGTGKSSVGKIAAKKIGLTFIDTDQEIENQSGLSISKIFEKHGESKFRELEKEFIQNGHAKSGCLVSCGGGLPITEGMIKTLKDKGMVYCLWANVETIFERTAGNLERPLLQTENPKAEIKSILQKRESVYLTADQIVSTEKRSMNQVAEIIVEKYRDFSD